MSMWLGRPWQRRHARGGQTNPRTARSRANGRLVGRVGTASAHVALVKRRKGARWYLRGRHPDGRTFQRCLGRAWQERGRPPAGYLTRAMARAERDAFLTDARRGLISPSPASNVT